SRSILFVFTPIYMGQPCPHSILLNLFNPGRLWGAHYFIQSLAERCQSIVIPAGPFTPSEITNWAKMLQDTGINALAGAPTGLADFSQGLQQTGYTLPIDTIIWMGETWTKTTLRTVQRAFPSAGFWCDYGSVETHSIAVNCPDCDLNKFHLLTDQLIELDDQGALLTRIGDGWTVPIVRYRLGDLIQQASCPCGRPNALALLGRADDSVSLCSALLSVSRLLQLTYENEGVEEVQILLCRKDSAQKSADSIIVQFTGRADAEKVRKHLLNGAHNLAAVVKQYPLSFKSQRVKALKRISRTNKTPQFIWVTTNE
ncbi:hypothetical protein MO867_15015, partial [Microbulbifer sp. OS29]